MIDAPGTDRHTRIPLSRHRALTTAVALADDEGLGSVTMRRLARELGVEAMSLYHHVANKDEILDGMVELVFAEIRHPADGVPWKSAMRERAESVRAVLRQHPWAISILQSRTSPGPENLGHLDALIGCCRKAGFSIVLAAHAASLVDSYVYGFVLQEVNLPTEETGGLEAVIDGVLPHLERDFPYLAELTMEHVLAPGYRYADEFDFGIDLILDGLEGATR